MFEPFCTFIASVEEITPFL
ncbi:rCG24853, partial [Rattus norvegicus]